MIAILGGGCSGLFVAANLRRHFPHLSLAIVEPGPLGGVAYSTTEPTHLLNVRASRMSAWVDAPDDFARWAEVPGDSFSSRWIYGEYLRQLIDPATVINARAEQVEGPLVRLSNGRTLEADAIVLALGHHSGRPTEALPAWQPLPELDPHQPVVILGTGLTCIDVFLALKARGFRGQVHAISRHGWLPQPHEVQAVAPRAPEWHTAPSLRAAVRAVRAHCELGGSWQSGVDGVRPLVQSLWASFSEREKARFVRHLSTAWGVHRHRLAPQISVSIQNALAEGQLRIHAGRLLEVSGSRVRFRARGRAEELEGQVVSALGPSGDQHPLISALIEEGLAQPGPLGLGVRTDATATGAILDRSGIASNRLFTLGPLRRGELWESTAVGELREQARQLAARLAAQSIR